MKKLVECVPNFSEGRDVAVIKQITDQIEAVKGVTLLDVDPGADTNRVVVTFIGSPEAVKEAAFRAARRASELIDMSKHRGSHPRMGALDVCPFVPVVGVTMDDCVAIAKAVGQRLGEELQIPVYLYESAATRPERKNLASIRAGEYEGLPQKLADPTWTPDFGPRTFNTKSGATAVGAREFLIAYNINLNTTDKRYADDIAYALRERGRHKRHGNISPFYYKGKIIKFEPNKFPCGPCDFVASNFDELATHYRDVHGNDLVARYKELGYREGEFVGKEVYDDGKFTHVKAVGWVVEKYRRAQISINLTKYKISPAHLVLEEAREQARERGIVVTGSEIVGVVPYEAMLESGKFYLRRMQKSAGIPYRDVIETAVQSMGLRDVAEFDLDKKVIGLPVFDGPLVNKKVTDFVDEVSRDTPAPGGGSIAALAGSLGAALAAMVANLSIGKPEFDAKYDELNALAEKAQALKDQLLTAIDEDTQAFNAVLEAMRMPKDSPEQQAARREAMEAGYKHATQVPLRTAQLCREALNLCLAAAKAGNTAMMSDAGVGALVAYAGVKGAVYNVRINLPQIKDKDFAKEINMQLATLLREAREVSEAVEREVERVLAG
ncbi:glutamate formimidoyltransferase [candidate division KSB1 bacterium]|nr:glutamate formimidoyltransferase [candidate division KSB1 bacterium]